MDSKSSGPAALAVAGVIVGLVAAAPARAQYPDPLYPETHDRPCERSAVTIRGIGASFARTAHLNWGAEILAPDAAAPLAKGFGYDAGGCFSFELAADGGTRTVTYAPSGSGAGLSAFGATTTIGAGRNATYDFGGVDKPPTPVQIANANEGPDVDPEADPDDGTLHTIPVAQGAVAVVVRVPDGCEIPNVSARQVSRARLEGFFRGLQAYNQFGELFGYLSVKASAGSGLTNTECGSKVPKRVVRFDDSGTTFVFKKYLHLASPGLAFRWREAAQGGTLANTAWPSNTINAGVAGNGALLDTLSAQGETGGIGYSDLGGARSRGYGWDYSSATELPATDDRTFWVRVQRIADDAHVNPARVSNQVGTKGARCSAVSYAGEPVAGTEGSWINADAVGTPSDYPICGLTYVLAWEAPSAMGLGNVARSVGRRDYIGYMLDRPGLGTLPVTSQCNPSDDRFGRGQCKLDKNDYARLPSAILTRAQEGMLQLGP
jgi:ABC-type phosphate transport system substrate-binding protein